LRCRTAAPLDQPPLHRHQEFLTFLRQIARAYPQQDLPLIMDNYAALS